MTSLDWKWLLAIANGESGVAPDPHQDKLIALNFIVARYRKDSYALTGLGREALLRKKYKLGLPQSEAEESLLPVEVDALEEMVPLDTAVA